MGTLDVVDDESFHERVIRNPRPVLVFFSASGCQPCQLQARWLPPLAAELGSAIEIVRCSIEEAPRAARASRVTLVPNLTLFHGGRPIGCHVGVWPLPSIRAWLRALLQKAQTPVSLPTQYAGPEGRERTRVFVRAFFSPATRSRACKVASLVAPLLLLVNHSDLLLRAPLSFAVLRHLALNFLVPFLVSSYSAARAATEDAAGVP